MFLNLVMNKGVLLLAIGVAAVLAVVLAPSLTGTALARKQETCTVGESDTVCPGASSGTSAARNTCAAGVNEQTHPRCP